jgi:hypothetical protein
MAQVVPQGDGFGQIFIEKHRPGDGPGNLGYFQRMGQPRTVFIAQRIEKDLGFVLQPPECI